MRSQRVADTAPYSPSESAASPSRRQPLDELINNELPLVEEEATFPTGLKLHGRTVGFRYLIHGSGAEPRGPHFTPAASRPRPRTVGVASVPQPQPATPPPPGPAPASGSLDEEADQRAGNGVAATSDSGGPAPRANSLSPMERALLARRKGRPS
jgi:hypothetical protein